MALVGNALLSPEDLLRLMLQDLGAMSTAIRVGLGSPAPG